MAVSPALTNAERSALLGASTLVRYLSPVQDTEVATSRINQATFVYPLAQLTVDTTSGGWSNVAPGMTVYIGGSAGAHDKGIFRVRKAGTGTTLFLAETSGGDPGLLPQTIRTASFANNDYITVLDRFDIWSILPRINFVTGVIYEDYDLTYTTFNETPPPLTYIYINGRRNHLFDYITGDALAITAVASVIKWPTSTGSTVTYAWTVPPEWTDVSGATTATLTANAPPGNYILRCVITDSIGGAFQRVSYVNIHDADNNPPLLISNMPRTDMRDRVGRRMSFDLYDDRLTSLQDGAAVGYFEVATWGGTWWQDSTAVLDGAINSLVVTFDVDDGSVFAEGDTIQIDAEEMLITGIVSDTLTVTRAVNDTTATTHSNGAAIRVYEASSDVPSASRQFVGWIQQIETHTEAGLRQGQIDIISPAHLLQMLNNTSQVIAVASNPSIWQQAVASLMSASFMAWYMLTQRVGNLMRLFNFTTYDVNPAGQRLPKWQIDKGSIYQQIQLLATDRGNFGCNSEGEFFFLRLPQMVDYSSRSSVVVRDLLDASIYQSSANVEARIQRTVQIRGEGFSWNGSASLPTPYYSDAPVSPGQGGAPAKLLSQVVTSQDEINQLTGDYYALKNNPFSLSVNIQKNRDVYEPAELPFVRVTIPDYLSPFNVEFQRYIVPLSVSKKHNPDGTVDIALTGDTESHGLPGGTVPVPAPNVNVYTPPYVPPVIDPPPVVSIGDWPPIISGGVPSGGEPTIAPGKAAIKNDETHVWRTYDVTVTSPVWDDVTPADGFTGIVQTIMSQGTTYSRAAFVLLTDGTDSQVARTTDIFATTPTWEYGDTVSGEYSQIVSTRGVPEEVYINGVADTGGPCADFFDVINGIITDRDSTSVTVQAVLIGLGHYQASLSTFSADICCSCTNEEFVGDPPGSSFASYWACGTVYPGDGQIFDTPVGHTVTTVARESTGDPFTVKWTFSTGSFTVGVSRRSTDAGAAFETARPYGTIASPPGFDVGRQGLAAIAGDSERVVVSLDGGAYDLDDSLDSLTGTYPLCIKVPELRAGSSSLSNISTDPSMLFACADFIDGDPVNGAVFKYTVAKIDITPIVGGDKAVGSTRLGIDMWRGKMTMFLGLVDDGMSVAQYLFTSRSAGGSWLHSLHPEALSIRAQRFSTNGYNWIMAQGDDGVAYSSNFGTTWVNKGTDRAIYAELFG